MTSRYPFFMTVAASAGCLACGCTTTSLPREFDRTSVRIIAASTLPKVDVSGSPGGKPGGAGVGAGTGSGIGIVATAVACAATGPLVGICLATVLPAATVVGAVAGGVVGAARTESAESISLKTRALANAFAATPYQVQLTRDFQRQSGIAAGSQSGASLGKTWTLEVGIAEVNAEGGSEFAVRLVAYAQLRHDGASPAWQTRKDVQSDTRLTTAQWLAEDSKALRSVLDRCIEKAAHRLAAEIANNRPTAADNEVPLSTGPTSCQEERSPRNDLRQP